MKKMIVMLLALLMCLAFIPMTVSAAEETPWTGLWYTTDYGRIVLWQDGDKVTGIEWIGANPRFEGTISGNVLKGTLDNFEDKNIPFEATISADGNSISGYMDSDTPFEKIIGYSNLSPSYVPGSAMSWSGLWDVHDAWWGPTIIAQDGDKVTGFCCAGGKFEGAVSGNTLTVAWLKGEYGYSNEAVFTMSPDGKNFKITGSYIRDYELLPPGERLSRIAYESGQTITPPVKPTVPAQPPTQPTVPAQTPVQPTVRTTSPGVTPTPPQSESFTAVSVASGVKLEWMPIDGVLGYRIYRSTTLGEEDISITDFYITSTSFVDVNVDANTTYDYTLRAVLTEANITGQREQMGSPSNRISVRTGASILGGEASSIGGRTKHVILMKLDDPYMSVEGRQQEIDYGRGTAPILQNGRTLVPIRAIIEAMGGMVGWDEATQKISLDAGGHSVQMWLNKKDLLVDGKNKTMDVAPVTVGARTMVPVRFAAENVGCTVEWIEPTSEIVIVYYTDGTEGRLVKPAQPNPGSMQPTPAPEPVPQQPETQPSGGESTASTNGPEIKISYTAAELAKITADVEALIQDAPTGGKQITLQELENLKKPYIKSLGSGDTYYSKTMNGDFKKDGEKWKVASYMNICDIWHKSAYMLSKDETLYVKSYDSKENGAVKCHINKEDERFYYLYEWYKNAVEGVMSKISKTSSDGGGYNDASDYDIAKMNDLKVTLYADTKVAGQDCIVYSYSYTMSEANLYVSVYYWFSKSKGIDILQESIVDITSKLAPDALANMPSDLLAPSANATFWYDSKMVNKDNGFFDETKQGVTKWIEQ
jgi:hypothetical protein